MLVVDIAILLDQRHIDTVGTTKLSLVMLVHLHVLVLERDRLVEPGVHMCTDSEPGEDRGHHAEQGQHQHALAVDDRLDHLENLFLHATGRRAGWTGHGVSPEFPDS